MNSTQLVDRLNRFYDKLGTDKKYSFLIAGNWGIGKTYTYNEFVENKEQVYYYSLFGINNLRELEKMIIKSVVFPTIEKLNSGSVKKTFGNMTKGLFGSIPVVKELVGSLMPSNIIDILSLKDLKFSEKSLVCLDDLERCKIPMEDLMGFVERLKQKTNIVILCNEDEIGEAQAEENDNKDIYITYKEKVIDFTYSLEEVEDKIILGKLSELKLSTSLKSLTNVYEFEYKELMVELKKYLLGSKDNLDEIVKNLKIEVEKTKGFLENEVKQYFLLDQENLLKLCENIEEFVEKSTMDNYVSSDDLGKLYRYYIYISEIIEKNLNKNTQKKLEKFLYEFYKCKKYPNPVTLIEPELTVVYNKLSETLESKFRNDLSTENIKKIKQGIEDREYDEILKLVKDLKRIPKILEDYLNKAFVREISSTEWELWHRIADNLENSEKRKLESIVGDLKIEDKVIQNRIDQFVKNKNLDIQFK